MSENLDRKPVQSENLSPMPVQANYEYRGKGFTLNGTTDLLRGTNRNPLFETLYKSLPAIEKRNLLGRKPDTHIFISSEQDPNLTGFYSLTRLTEADYFVALGENSTGNARTFPNLEKFELSKNVVSDLLKAGYPVFSKLESIPPNFVVNDKIKTPINGKLKNPENLVTNQGGESTVNSTINVSDDNLWSNIEKSDERMITFIALAYWALKNGEQVVLQINNQITDKQNPDHQRVLIAQALSQMLAGRDEKEINWITDFDVFHTVVGGFLPTLDLIFTDSNYESSKLTPYDSSRPQRSINFDDVKPGRTNNEVKAIVNEIETTFLSKYWPQAHKEWSNLGKT